MRLITTSQDSDKCIAFSEYLTSQGIENKLEILNEQDWGREDFGVPTYKIWVIDEDEFEKAQKIVDDFFANPGAPEFEKKIEPASNIALTNLFTQDVEREPLTERKRKPARPTPWSKEPIGIVTLYLLIGCFLLYFISLATQPVYKEAPSPMLPPVPIYFSKTEKNLLFDYPKAYEIIDKLVNAYGIDQIHDLNDLPKEGITLFNQYTNTPYWKGYYEEVLRYLKNPQDFKPSNAPMFEKIRQGEFWRLFSPAMLHGGIFHLIFNMMWLAVVGRQLEQRMGRWRYLFFILITGIIANVVQYLMDGPNFLGFSGILCAMVTFVWARQRRFPWEGYQLDRSTFNVLILFLFTMLGIQLISFYTDVAFNTPVAPPIANAAHMTGLALGYILGHFNFFAWK